MFSHRIHGIHRTDWQRVSSHRFHGIHRIDWQRMFSHRILGIHRTDWQRVSSHRIHGIDLQRDVLPQISQIYTDGACLEFCEFCVFCGTSHAPVNLCKSVQSVGGLFSTLLQNRLAEDVLPQNSQNRLAEMFSHRIHGIHRTDWQRMFSHRIHRIDWQRCSPTEFTEFTEQTGRGCSPTEFTE